MVNQDLLRQLPAVNDLLQDEQIQQLAQTYNMQFIKENVQQVIAKQRHKISINAKVELDPQVLVKKVKEQVTQQAAASLTAVINATGIILHTNLGRAVLAPAVQQELQAIAFNYSNLEYNVSAKARGSRYDHVEKLLTQLTKAPAALVVNNNAAAVMLILATLAQDREVIVSRGELVEIGGSFRIPEIITSIQGHLTEVGTTNKTRLSDYQRAINEQTGAILKVHTSNYKIVGFTETVAEDQLLQLARSKGLPLITDLGSGLMVDLKAAGIESEPTVAQVVQNSDLVAFSGDKLLGGPQAGIIVGQKKYIDQLKQNQLLRALRIDKLTLAALEATLRIYQQGADVWQAIPTLQMLTSSSELLLAKAHKLQKLLAPIPHLTTQLCEGFSAVGGGTFPDLQLPTFLVEVQPKSLSVTQLDTKLRQAAPPIITRVKDNTIQLDVRTLSDTNLLQIAQTFKEIMADKGAHGYEENFKR